MDAVLKTLLSPNVDIFCSGAIRSLPRAIWDRLEGPKPDDPASYLNNGCTMSPDMLRGKRTWPACVLHDFHYNVGFMNRKQADDIFRRNLETCLKADGMLHWLAKLFAYFYYRVVRRAGAAFYNSMGDPA